MRRCVALGLLSLLLATCLIHEGVSVVALVATSTRTTALYDDLGVAKSSSKNEIKKAFRALTRQHHPDLKETYQEKEDAKATMARVLRAYEVLSDDKKRAAYDESGAVPGEAPNIEEMTADELFRHYHQSSPIFSKSATLSRVDQLRRLQNFRGPRVFLIHVYDDTQCKNCRHYSAAWETMYQSSLVQAGVLEMYRIDALSEDGKPLLDHLGIRYRKEPLVVAIVDGEVWTLYSIAESMNKRTHDRSFQNLLEFVMSFFYNVFEETTSLEAAQLDDLLTFLRAPRSAKQPLRVLLPKIHAESIPLALQMRYHQIALRSVPRNTLIEFVEEYCAMEIDVKDRFGESIAMPEFIVVSTEVLPTPSNDADGASTASTTPERSCRLVHIGAAVALTYGKASGFLESHLPERHVGMKGLRYVGAADFLDVCRENCLVWLREDCSKPPDARVTALMAHDYLSFKTGYWCMEEERNLASAMSKAGVWTATSEHMEASPSAIVAFVGGNDHITYQLVSLQTKPLEEITRKDVYAALSTLIDTEEEVEKGDEAASVATPIQSRLPQPVSSLLATDGFPMTYKQRLYIQIMTLYTFVAPLLSNAWPFFLMYLVQRFILNRNRPADENGGQSNDNDAKAKKPGEANATANGHAETGEASAPPVRRRIRKPQPRVGPYNSRDMIWAKEEKGFLLFLVRDDLASGSLPLPRIAMEEPFTVRVLGTGQSKWREWILTHKPAVPEGAEGDLPEAERSISVMAIRKTRMKSLVKSDAQTIDAFLRDLLDGTKNPSDELPLWAYDEE